MTPIISFSTLCGFLVVRRLLRRRVFSNNEAFQYPLRVLGCEKAEVPAKYLKLISFSTLCGFLVVRSTERTFTCDKRAKFQYPLRVLGCEKLPVPSQ